MSLYKSYLEDMQKLDDNVLLVIKVDSTFTVEKIFKLVEDKK